MKKIKSNNNKILIVSLCLILLCQVFFLSGCGTSREELEQIAKELSCYQISIDYDNQSKTLTAKQTVEYKNNSDSVLRQLKFHVYPKYFEQGHTDKVVAQNKVNNCYRHGMSYSQFDMQTLKVGDDEVGIIFEGEDDAILTVDLPTSLMPTETVSVFMEYKIVLPNCEHRFGYGDDTVNLANFYPIACVHENNDFSTNPYNPNGDPFYSDVANYLIDITMDNGLKIASTGNQIDYKQQGEKQTFYFKAQVVRDFACVLSEKFSLKTQQLKDVTVNYYYYNDGNADICLQTAVDAINTFSKKFGSYPYQTFNVVKCDFLHGGMEYPNLVMISDDIDILDEYLNVIVHETAHQWWYGVVGNDEYNLPWLDEALTEFSTALFYDYNENYNLTHEKIIKSNKQNYSLFVSVYQDVLGEIDTSLRPVDEYDTEPEYTYCVYVKGCLMFESLFSLIGEKKFIKALNLYYQQYKFKNVNMFDLIESFSSVAGGDLTSFFDSWVKGKVVIS